MYSRKLFGLLRKKLTTSPAVALLGPRQSGKTTLAKRLAKSYFDLELEEERLRLDLEWGKILSNPTRVVLDEAQAWPGIFPKIRAAIDSHPRWLGKFLILGSVAPALMRNVSESLAGRLALCELTPFYISELPARRSGDNLWLYGGFPKGGILQSKMYPDWQLDYLKLLAQRDLPNWGLPAKPQTTEKFFKMLAYRHGHVWNASQIGQSLGLNFHTINSYLDYLINAYLVRLLPPYHANIGKRLVSSPKLYWRDSGLVHALMNVESSADLIAQPWVGMSWEGWVIEQILSALGTLGVRFEAYYLRDNNGLEIDLILKFSKELWAIEIKLTGAPNLEQLHKLNRNADLFGAGKRFLISRTSHPVSSSTCLSTNLKHFLTFLPDK